MNEDEIIVIGYEGDSESPRFNGSQRIKCETCDRMLWFSVPSQAKLKAGALGMCVYCATKRIPPEGFTFGGIS
jgi:hypothetical protein